MHVAMWLARVAYTVHICRGYIFLKEKKKYGIQRVSVMRILGVAQSLSMVLKRPPASVIVTFCGAETG